MVEGDSWEGTVEMGGGNYCKEGTERKEIKGHERIVKNERWSGRSDANTIVTIMYSSSVVN